MTKKMTIALALFFLPLGFLSATPADEIAALKKKLRQAEVALLNEKVKSSKAEANAARLMAENQSLRGTLKSVEADLKAKYEQEAKALKAELDRTKELIDSVGKKLKEVFGENFETFDEIPGIIEQLLDDNKRFRSESRDLQIENERLSEKLKKLTKDQ